VEERVIDLEHAVFNALFYPERNTDFSLEHVKSEMNYIYESIKKEHKGLYLDDVKDMMHKLELFGFHFASLDIRQDSRVHHGVFAEIVSHPEIQKYVKNLPANYVNLSEEERCMVLPKLTGDLPSTIFSDEITHQTLESIRAMQVIQGTNGERGCNRYIISNCQTLENILELFAMCRMSAWKNPKVDFIPLFETIPDLETAAEVMDGLFSNSIYKEHCDVGLF
jgi:phosphoenolpyruvate carboxylase